MSNPNNFKLGDFLPYRLSILSNMISGAIAEIYQEKYVLSITEWRIMVILGSFRSATATEIVQHTALDKVAISRGVKKLLERGFIERKANSDDRRRLSLRLSDLGFEVYNEIIPKAIEYEQQLSEKLGRKDFQDLERIVNKLSELTKK